MQRICSRLALVTFTLVFAAGIARAGEVYVQTNLVSDGSVPGTKWTRT